MSESGQCQDVISLANGDGLAGQQNHDSAAERNQT